MATTTDLSLTIRDEEPHGCEAVVIQISRDAYEFGVAIEITQGTDVLAMSIEHARAVHAALGRQLAEVDGV